MLRLKKELQNIKTVFFITLVWIISVLLYFSIIFQAIEVVKPGEIDFTEQYFLATIIATLMGVMNGIFEVYVFKNLLKRMPFVLITILKTFLFMLAFFLTIIILLLLNPIDQPQWETIDDASKFFNSFKDIFYTREMISHAIYVVIISFSINFFLQINRKMGKGVLLNLFIGTYHSPVEAKRIIMFVDLTSSSSIAETLPPRLYSSFIKDFFYDIDDIAELTRGSIHQFVGDEAVIVWKIKDGVENNNCLKFFFLVKDVINKKNKYYMDKYGIVPDFKAGLHYGDVVITEVGGSKQEIAYHGDTTNTAARIRSECNSKNKQLLVSAELLSMCKNADQEFEIEYIGITNLKGKNNVLALFTLFPKNKKV